MDFFSRAPKSMDRRVALKVLPAGVAADDRALTRFVREAKTAGRLNHPNVVSVYGMGLKEQTPCYSMETSVKRETARQLSDSPRLLTWRLPLVSASMRRRCGFALFAARFRKP